MDTKASFIGQMSDSILRLIFPKSFYYLCHTFRTMVVGITYQDLFKLNPPAKIISNPLFKKLSSIAQFCNRKGWKPDNVTSAACFYFQLKLSYLPKVATKQKRKCLLFSPSGEELK
jgi:hypothetical protein